MHVCMYVCRTEPALLLVVGNAGTATAVVIAPLPTEPLRHQSNAARWVAWWGIHVPADSLASYGSRYAFRYVPLSSFVTLRHCKYTSPTTMILLENSTYLTFWVSKVIVLDLSRLRNYDAKTYLGMWYNVHKYQFKFLELMNRRESGSI